MPNNLELDKPTLKFNIFWSLVFVVFLFYGIGVIVPSLRYLKYSIPFVAIFILLIKNSKNPKNGNAELFLRNILVLHIFIIGYTLILLLIKQDFYLRFIEECFFILAPILLAYIISYFYKPVNTRLNIKYLFWVIAITYIISQGSNIIDIVLNPKLFIDGILYSKISTESGFSFVFGPFFVYFLLTKNYKYAIYAVFFSLLSLKRISLLGATVCFLLYYFGRPLLNTFKKQKTLTGLIFVFINIGLVLVTYLIAEGFFDDFVFKHLGISTNYLLRGRYNTYNFVLNNLASYQPLGIGLGKTTFILTSNDFPVKILHSDLFKNFLEFGFPLFCIWILVLYKNSSLDIRLLVMAIFYNILFLTDNVYIYFEVMFTFYFFAIVILSEKSSKNFVLNTVNTKQQTPIVHE